MFSLPLSKNKTKKWVYIWQKSHQKCIKCSVGDHKMSISFAKTLAIYMLECSNKFRNSNFLPYLWNKNANMVLNLFAETPENVYRTLGHSKKYVKFNFIPYIRKKMPNIIYIATKTSQKCCLWGLSGDV